MDLKRIEDMELRLKSITYGYLPGWKLVFNVIDNKNNGTGYANILPDQNSHVEGLIYELDEASLKILDYYEDYPEEYNRQTVTVTNDDGLERECLVYIANPAVTKDGLKPHKLYLQNLLNGKLFLSPDYLEKLKKTETVN